MTAVALPPKADRAALPPDLKAGGELRRISLGELVESPWNPRKHFDPAKLAEMVESLRKGQLAPIIVRPACQAMRAARSYDPAGRMPLYEIGAGHRRFRAAPGAGLTSLMAIIRDMDDVAFLELLTIENKQRDDVTPLDEANGFRLLMEKAGYDVAKLAARIGLSTKYVYDRIKLLQLIPAAKKLLEDGVITAGHAILLARLSPTDQKRAIGDEDKISDNWRGVSGGLFESENVDGFELEDAVKPRSVRELASWIDDHIRAQPEALDPFLFPETVGAIAAAKLEDEKVVHITHDYRVQDDARDEKQRTYGEQSWKRADGTKKAKTCEHSVLGVVVAGHGRGEAFRVCVAKEKCKTHWATEQREKAQINRAAPNSQARQQQLEREQAQRAREDIERARWERARPQLVAALAAKVAKEPTGYASRLGKLLLRYRTHYQNEAGRHLPAERTSDDLLRRLAFATLLGDFDGWRPWVGTAAALKPFGIDAKKIVDGAVPIEVKKAKKGSR